MTRVELKWDPFDPLDPGPCIDVEITNSRDVIQAGLAIGLEYPASRRMRALLDTGASITVVSRVFADYCKLFQTNEGSEITAIGATHRCAEHAGAIKFPGTDLRPLDPVRIVSAVFAKERHYACLIGRDILRNWAVTFDGRSKPRNDYRIILPNSTRGYQHACGLRDTSSSVRGYFGCTDLLTYSRTKGYLSGSGVEKVPLLW